ncbi:MAG: SpoIID/LytB domain-containing protein [Cryomorphaceae bacterium]|nr:SpoIID/LytB domain-containing protein [Cryomorphaceae bacterium]
MRIILLVVVLCAAVHANCQQLRIGLYRENNVLRIHLSYNDGSYRILGDTSDFGAILPNEFVEISFVKKGSLILRKNNVELGTFTKVFLLQNQPGTSLVLAPKSPALKQRKYMDDFELTAGTKGLTLVNLVDMDHYLGGVVESEGGPGKNIEYYKVQAVISRTYALKYLQKHKKEGFDLCDRTHCQAYLSMLKYSPEIDSAVRQTRDVIIRTGNGSLIDAYFHANCGGQTCEPQMIWNEEIPYLNSFKDTFCIYTKQATWEKRIPKKEWIEFLVLKYGYPIYDSLCASMVCNFDQKERMAFYLHPIFGIPLRDIRDHFDLKSTFFSCHLEGEEVVLNGRGFGHGVGMCQEGAMKMARLGYNYQQIIRFYFPGVVLENSFDERLYRLN